MWLLTGKWRPLRIEPNKSEIKVSYEIVSFQIYSVNRSVVRERVRKADELSSISFCNILAFYNILVVLLFTRINNCLLSASFSYIHSFYMIQTGLRFPKRQNNIIWWLEKAKPHGQMIYTSSFNALWVHSDLSLTSLPKLELVIFVYFSRDSKWHIPSVAALVQAWAHSLSAKSAKNTQTVSWTLTA